MTGAVETLARATGSAESEATSRWLAEVWRACGAFEWVTFALSELDACAVGVFHRNIPHAATLFCGSLCDCGGNRVACVDGDAF